MRSFCLNARKKEKGIVVTFVLVFGAVFLMLLFTLIGFILLNHRQSLNKVAWEDSLHIAEAGVNYYRWRLNHDPADVQDGEDWCCSEPPCDVCGPYEHDFRDPDGNLMGRFILEIEPKEICGEILGVYVKSTAYTLKSPDIRRTVQVKFASTSIAEYAYIINDNVWAGEDRKIYGKYHSNGGIRMDGTNNSLVTSARDTWLCTDSFDCDYQNCPSGCVREGYACRCPGIFGDGGPEDLWKNPIPSFDFDGVTSDLSRIKSLAEDRGRYYPSSSDLNPNGQGYHVVFNSDGTFDIRIITQLRSRYAYSSDEGWHWNYEKILNETTYASGVSLPESCGLVYVEDDLWVDGIVKGEKTIAAANLIDPQEDAGVFINWNIDYTVLDGSDSLGVLTEENILIPLESPNEMIIRGVYLAQKGHFGRDHYDCGDYPSWCKRNSLIVNGSIVSNGRVGTKWVQSNGSWASGYNQRENYFDERLARDPPPLLPFVSESLQFIFWEEIPYPI